jgi:putative phosphoesterase
VKIAFISDIHSNLQALETVLKDITEREVDEIYCLGDLTSYHCFPNEVIDTVRQRNIPTIMGNNDLDIVEGRIRVGSPKEWNLKELSSKNLNWLKSLPDEIEIQKLNRKIKLVHGSPRKIDEYMYEGTNSTTSLLRGEEADILVVGHTHLPYYCKYGDKLLINSGSVGKPKLGRPNATYAILELDWNLERVEIVELEYPLEELVEALVKNGFSEKLIEEIRTGVVD